jgi:FkbM family methyltransferase
MKSWRLRWTLKEIFTFENYIQQKKTLYFPWKYWITLLLKLFPGLWPKPVLFKLRKGGVFSVKEFMFLYIYREVFIDKCYDKPKLTSKEPTIIDVGANAGLFTIRMKQLYPSSKIYCFEPFASNFEELSKNIERSNFRDVKLFPYGVGGITRKEKLYIHKTNIGGHSIIQAKTQNDQYVEIDLVSLKDIIRDLKITKCDLLKMDCEGAEGEIIKSIDRNIASLIEKMIFEPSPEAYDIEEIKLHLRNLGYLIEEHQGLCIALKENRDSLN